MILSVLNSERRCTVERIVELTNQVEGRLKLLCGGKYSKYKVANS